MHQVITMVSQVSDGPSGARGEIFGEGVPAAFLPCGVSLGATWDEELLFEVGQLLASEVSLTGFVRLLSLWDMSKQA
jgi:beta-glucosidase-like glycosyl hydrolase